MGTPAGTQEATALVATVPFWYHRIEVRPGLVTPGIHDSAASLARLPLPESCAGMRVLDIGARDGFFAFELERRGATVVAIDVAEPSQSGFDVARRLLGSRVEYQVSNVYDLSVERHGEFDLVLFLGVLYHLRDPMLALDRIWDVCRGEMIFETQVLDNAVLAPDGSRRRLDELDSGLPGLFLAQFCPGDLLSGDHSNWWVPSVSCLEAMVEAAGFDVRQVSAFGERAVGAAVRRDDDRQVYRTLDRAGTTAALASMASYAAAGQERELMQTRIDALERELAAARVQASRVPPAGGAAAGSRARRLAWSAAARAGRGALRHLRRRS